MTNTTITQTLKFGPTVTRNASADVMARAFSLVCPEAWGHGDWKAKVSAVLDPADLAAASVTLDQVALAVSHFTATEATVTRTQTLGGAECFIVRADGYRVGPAW